MNRQKNNIYIWLGLAVLMTGAAACAKKAPETPPPSRQTSGLMVVLSSPYSQAFDIRTVWADTFLVNKEPVVYPGLLQYTSVPSGTRALFVQISGTGATSSVGGGTVPIYYFKPGASYTYIQQTFTLQEDDLTPPAAGYAKIRVLQAADYARKLDCIIHNGDTLTKAASPWVCTAFVPVKAGDYQLDLLDSDAPHTFKTSLQTSLDAGKTYTLLVIGVPVADTSSVQIGAKLITNK